MLEFYVESGFRLRQLREGATGDYMDPFADWLESAGFRRRSAQLLLRGAAHLGEWAAIEQVQIEQFDQRGLDIFADHLAECCCTHPFRGCDRRNLREYRKNKSGPSTSLISLELLDVYPANSSISRSHRRNADGGLPATALAGLLLDLSLVQHMM